MTGPHLKKKPSNANTSALYNAWEHWCERRERGPSARRKEGGTSFDVQRIRKRCNYCFEEIEKEVVMILHLGERVYWGAPEVIYLEGTITALDEQAQTAIVHIDRATIHSAHLIGTDIPFAVDGIKPLVEDSPPNTTTEHSVERAPAPAMSDEEKIRRAAAAVI